MDVRALECFVAVARHEHFTRAADALYLTQSAVSQQVRRLEASLGVELFVRSAGGVALTPAGEELLPRARAVLAALQDARAAVTGAAVGTVRVAAEHPAALAPAVAAFARAAPAVRVSFAGGDVYVGADPPAWPSRPLPPEPLVVLGTESAAGVAVGDLRGRRILLPERGTALRALIEGACEAAGFGAVPVVEVSDVAAAIALARAGAGVALLPANWAPDGIPLHDALSYEAVVAVRPGAPAAATAFADAVLGA